MKTIIPRSERGELLLQIEGTWRSDVDRGVGRAHRNRALQLREAVIAHVFHRGVGIDSRKARIAQLIIVFVKVDGQVVRREARIIFLELGRFLAKVVEVEFWFQILDAPET